jgi:cytochrome bd-type quinol oxidase subunit 2
VTAAAIGDLTGAVMLLVVVFFVIGVLASVNWIWRKAWRYSERRIDRRSY